MNKIFIDNSGSTQSKKTYWESVKTIITNFGDHEYYFWNTETTRVTYNKVSENTVSKRGSGGTAPECFLMHLSDNDNIIIVTDGEISDSDVSNCVGKLEKKNILLSSVTIHFIGDSNVNMSVAAPFTKYSKSSMLYLNQQHLGSAEKDIDLDKYYNNPELFLQQSDEIYKQITITNLAQKSDNKLKNKLLDLKENLMATLLKMDKEKTDYTTLRTLLENGNYDGAIIAIKDIIKNCDNTMALDIEHKILVMCGQCDKGKKLNFSFQQLQPPTRLQRAAEIDEVDITKTLKVHNIMGNFECPITFEEDVPVLLINKGDAVLDECDTQTCNMYLTNPLLILNDPILVKKIKDRIDHPVGLETAKKLLSVNDKLSPFTRKEIVGIISFTKNKTHKESTMWTLANLFFGNKIVGKHGFWLLVVYFVFKQIPYLSEDKTIFENLENSLIHLLKNTKVNLTLSDLPIAPHMKAPYDIALWYCLISPFVNPDPSNTEGNRLKMLCGAAPHIMELMDTMKYPYMKDWTTRQSNIYRAFYWLMRSEINHGQWRVLLRSQYQNSLTLTDGTIISLDGPTSNPPQLPDFSITLKEFLTLGDMVNTKYKWHAIDVPHNFSKLSRVPNYVYNYNYREPITLTTPTICRTTLRPFTYDLTTRDHWLVCAERENGNINGQLSAYNYFIQYVEDKKKYPTKDEFIIYMSRKQANREDGKKKDTLPNHIVEITSYLFSAYEKVLGYGFMDVDPSEFIRITDLSRPRDVRVMMEQPN